MRPDSEQGKENLKFLPRKARQHLQLRDEQHCAVEPDWALQQQEEVEFGMG